MIMNTSKKEISILFATTLEHISAWIPTIFKGLKTVIKLLLVTGDVIILPRYSSTRTTIDTLQHCIMGHGIN